MLDQEMAVMQTLWRDEMWPVSQKAWQGKESQSSGPGDKLNNEDGCEGCGCP